MIPNLIDVSWCGYNGTGWKKDFRARYAPGSRVCYNCRKRIRDKDIVRWDWPHGGYCYATYCLECA